MMMAMPFYGSYYETLSVVLDKGILMKILTTIPCYNENNIYVERVVEQLTSISDVVIFSPVRWDIPNVHTEIRGKEYGQSLVFEPRQFILDNIHEYDYFLYNEDDLLITPDSLLHAVEVNEKISKVDIQNNVTFLRYELENDVAEFVDLHPGHSVHLGGNGVSDVIRFVTKIDNEYYFSPWNLHSGTFLISREQLEMLIHNDLFWTEAKATYCGILESGASSFNPWLRKLAPTSSYKKLMIHHMSNKYVFNPVKVNINFLDNLFNFIPEDLSKKYL
jgi:hypothetical protein